MSLALRQLDVLQLPQLLIGGDLRLNHLAAEDDLVGVGGDGGGAQRGQPVDPVALEVLVPQGGGERPGRVHAAAGEGTLKPMVGNEVNHPFRGR